MPPVIYDLFVPLIEDEPQSAGWMLGLSGGRFSGPPIISAETLSKPAWPRWPDPHDADVEVRLALADGSERIAVCKVVTEWSEQVHCSLPAIVGFAFEQHRLPVSALLVCRTDALARRYRKGVAAGPGSVTAVAAVGPGDFPDLLTGPGPWNAGMAVASAAARRKPTNGLDDLFAATLDRWLAEFEDEQAADYAVNLLGLLAKQPAQLLRGVLESGTKPYHARYRLESDAAHARTTPT
jgi:hypothetical protein